MLILVVSVPLIAFAVLRCGGEATSAAPAVNRLERMLVAERTIVYEGMKEVVLGEEPQARTLHFFVDHEGPEGTALESAGVPAGRGRSWKQRGSRFYWLGNRSLLLKNYRVLEAGPERVCERDGAAIELRSIHEGRPSMRLVIDDQTGLVLSVDSRDYRGHRRFHSAFTSLLVEGEVAASSPGEGPAISPKDCSPRDGLPDDASRCDDRADTVDELAFSPVEPRFLPDGFERKGERRFRHWRSGLSTVYTDGLTWITMRQSAAPDGAEEMVVRQSSSGSRTTLRLVVNGVLVRIEGCLAPETLLKVIRSVGPREEPS